ncbi:hypothetical protein CJ195_14675 [Bacillus sp. UMB0899]|nr:hypothetical protein CJ195_14675 [Bacillus sp. UMB0899]
MLSYSYRNHNPVLPPGKYVYSSNFPVMMKQLSPTYNVPTEPVFMEHLLMQMEKKIRVVTIHGQQLDGVVTGVAIDHLQLTIGDSNYHIRFPNIIYFITPKT